MKWLREWLAWETGSGAVVVDVAILAGLAAAGWLACVLAQS
jgi:hypothetical protein